MKPLVIIPEKKLEEGEAVNTKMAPGGGWIKGVSKCLWGPALKRGEGCPFGDSLIIREGGPWNHNPSENPEDCRKGQHDRRASSLKD